MHSLFAAVDEEIKAAKEAAEAAEAVIVAKIKSATLKADVDAAAVEEAAVVVKYMAIPAVRQRLRPDQFVDIQRF